ncbi:hypothetical protein ACHAXS_003590 [Conticribra weissflogii]
MSSSTTPSAGPRMAARTALPKADPLESWNNSISFDVSSARGSLFSLGPRTNPLIKEVNSGRGEDALGIPVVERKEEVVTKVESTPHPHLEHKEILSSANESLNETKSSISGVSLVLEGVDETPDIFDSLEYSSNSLNDDNDTSSSISTHSVAELSRSLERAMKAVKSDSWRGTEEDHRGTVTNTKKKLRIRRKKLQRMMQKYEQKVHNFRHQIPTSNNPHISESNYSIPEITPKISNTSQEIAVHVKNEKIILPTLNTKDIEKNIITLTKQAEMPRPPFSLHCTICYDAFHPVTRPPIVLPCGHTYICEDCGKRLTKCMECRKCTKTVFTSDVTKAMAGGNTSSAFTPSHSSAPSEHLYNRGLSPEDNPSHYVGTNPAYSPRRYYGNSVATPRRSSSPRTLSVGDGGLLGTASNRGVGLAISGRQPQASSQYLTSLPTVPLAKNVAMIGMMEACMARDDALKTVERKKMQKLSQIRAKRDSDDFGSDDDSAYDEDEDGVYESGDDDDKVNFAFGTMHWTGNHGTYAVKDEGGVVVLPKSPQEGLFPQFSLSVKAEDDEQLDLNSKITDEPYLIQSGTLVQIVDVQNNIAKLARGRGFVYADSSQLVRIGPPRDELCSIEGMLHVSHHRRSELLALLQSSIMLEKGLVQQYQIAARDEHQRNVDNKLAWAAAKRLQGRAAAKSPDFNEDCQGSGDVIREQLVEKGDDDVDQGLEFENDPVLFIPSEAQSKEVESIRMQKLKDRQHEEVKPTSDVSSNGNWILSTHLGEPKQSKSPYYDSRSMEITSPDESAVDEFSSATKDDNSNDCKSKTSEHPTQKVREVLSTSLTSSSYESPSVILGCGSFFTLEPDENVEVIQQPETPQQTPSQTSQSSQLSGSPNALNHGSPSPPHISNSSGSFDSVDFRTGRSGHAGLSLVKKSPVHHSSPHYHHTATTSTVASTGAVQNIVPSPGTPRLMSEHRGIARIRQIRPTSNFSPARGGSSGQGARTSGDQSWFGHL